MGLYDDYTDEEKEEMLELEQVEERIDDALGDLQYIAAEAIGRLYDAIKEADRERAERFAYCDDTEHLEDEVRLLVRFIYNSGLQMPLQGHYIDMNDYALPEDPQKGLYELGGHR